tara:strand:+ start:119 stop:517 length:399 start_codon:yes stop_codon:yes gene_type:complete
MSYGFSAKLPLRYDSDDGPYSLLKTIKEMGQQNLRMLVLTNPGERIMDANFGVGVSQFVFEQFGNFAEEQLQQRILEQVSNYLPYINITNINFINRSEQNELGLEITYFIESFTLEEKLYLNLENDAAARGF